MAEAIAMLAKGEKAPAAAELHALVEEAVQQTKLAQNPQHEQQWMASEAATEAVLMAVNALQGAMQAYRALDIGYPVLFETLSPDLQQLAERMQPTDWYLRRKPGKGKKRSGPAQILPVAVIRAHQFALELLQRCGIKATTGVTTFGGGTITDLGRMICQAAGIPLHGGESTAAAELVAKGITRASGRLWPDEPLLP